MPMSKTATGEVSCRIEKNRYGQWTIHTYVTPGTGGYRGAIGPSKEVLIKFAKKIGCTHYFDPEHEKPTLHLPADGRQGLYPLPNVGNLTVLEALQIRTGFRDWAKEFGLTYG